MNPTNNIHEERFSLAGAIRNFLSWINYLLSVKLAIILGSIVIAIVFFTYQKVRRINYTAETTFVLESESGSGIGGFSSSIASLAGINIGSLTDENSLFQIDNIVELYNSYTIMKQTLLSEFENDGQYEKLITAYGRNNKLEEKWTDKGIDFEVPLDQLNVKHDSVLKVVVKRIQENEIKVAKPNRKLSILKVSYTSKNQIFAKEFNEVIVNLVNEIYIKTKTSTSGENLRVLSQQADSVKRTLETTLTEMAKFNDSNANLNSLKSELGVQRQKLSINAQVSAAVYEEIVKNLEIAKVTHRNKSPLIKVIDSPIYPLKDDRMKWYKAIVIGLIIGGILMTSYFTLKRAYRIIMSEDQL